MMQNMQHSMIGINLYALGFLPYSNATEDVLATKRSADFYFGWFMDPLVFGDYPEVMKKNVGTRLPVFSKLESGLLKGSFDFVALNYYYAMYVQNVEKISSNSTMDYGSDMEALWILKEGDTQGCELAITPWGLLKVLDNLKQVYGNPPVYIHENGQQTKRNGTLYDIPRVEYLRAYTVSLLDALSNNINLRGYFYWSFLDSVEVLTGYETTYGLYYIDLDDKNLKRYPKLSAYWYTNFLKGYNLNLNGDILIQKYSESHFSPM